MPRTPVRHAFALALALLLAAPFAAQAQQAEVLDEIAAVVGNRIILRSEVDALVQNFLQNNPGAPVEEVWGEALDELINQEVLAVHAERDTTIKVTEDQVEQALDRRIDAMAQQVGGRQRVEELYGSSIPEIKDDLRQDFSRRLAAEQLQSRRLQRVRITPSEVRAWYEAIPQDSLPELPEVVRLAHIVKYPEPSPEAEAEARTIIEAIRDSIVVGGRSIEEMAQQFSDDPGSRAEGGRISDIPLGGLVPEFAAILGQVQPGEISRVFRTPFGYHIVRLNERRGDVVDFNHVLIQVDRRQDDPTQVLAALSAIRDSIVTQGVPFERMARLHSEEETSARRGGRVVDPRSGERDLVLAALGPDWQRTLRDLEEGEISEPARAELLTGEEAYHIVLLQHREPEHLLSLETDYTRVEEVARREKQQRELTEWIDELRETVYVDVRLDPGELSLARF